MNLTEALDIFEDNLTDIRKACVENAGALIEQYSPYAEIDIDEEFTKEAICKHVNFLAIEEHVNPILTTIKRIDSYKYYKTNTTSANTVTDIDIQHAREASSDWFVEQAQLCTRKPHRGMCPFHTDTNPSLMLMKSKVKGTLYLKCFVCNEAWDSIGFIQKRDNVDFIQAVNVVNR